MHAIDEVDARLNIGADHLIFGHCHRPGPLPSDDSAAWLTRVGTRLHNAGNWVYEARFQRSAGADGAYWPGTGVVLEGSGPPRLERILEGFLAEELLAEHGDLTRPPQIAAGDPPAAESAESSEELTA